MLPRAFSLVFILLNLALCYIIHPSAHLTNHPSIHVFPFEVAGRGGCLYVFQRCCDLYCIQLQVFCAFRNFKSSCVLLVMHILLVLPSVDRKLILKSPEICKGSVSLCMNKSMFFNLAECLFHHGRAFLFFCGLFFVM